MKMTTLIIIGGLIILSLALYAGYLLLQLKKQQSHKQEAVNSAIEKRNANIFESVNTLCMAGIQGQCDLSEISIRVYCILDYVQGSNRIDVEKQFPALFELYTVVKEMARGDARQALPKQARMKQTLERQKAESRLNDQIVEELKQLQKRIMPLSSSSKEASTTIR